MQSSFVMFAMIMAFAFLMLIVIVSGPLSMLLKFIVRSAVGAGILYALNIVLAPCGIHVGVNLLTSCFVGFFRPSGHRQFNDYKSFAWCLTLYCPQCKI